MPYSLDPLQDNCYENTTVLKNKFDIRDEERLKVVEESISTFMITKALKELPFANVDFEYYKMLHEYVFSDIFEWAGTLRTVDMSKKGTRFCSVESIEQRGIVIFNRLRANEFLRKYKDDEFINEFTELYCDLNILHPFREGNGRIQRLFLTKLLKYIGYTLDFADFDKDELMIATIKSVNGDVFMLRDLFREKISR